MDEEDAVQLCATEFAYCLDYVKRNPRHFDPPQFMNLFKSAVHQRFDTLSVKAIRAHDQFADARNEDGEMPVDTDDNHGPLLAALREGSAELQQVLSVILNAPSEFLQILLNDGVKSSKKLSDNVWSMKLCRLCRTPSINGNVIGELRSLLQGDI